MIEKCKCSTVGSKTAHLACSGPAGLQTPSAQQISAKLLADQECKSAAHHMPCSVT